MPDPARGSNRAYLALGSNIDPERNLAQAVRLLSRHGNVLAVSRVYQTAPIGDAAQPDYLNAAVLLETPIPLSELRGRVIPGIESALGRVRVPGNRYAPRTIDIDVALFNREIVDDAGCRIPDPDILTRPFLALTLAELDPDYVHQRDGRTLREIAASLPALPGTLRRRDDVALSTADWAEGRSV